ncbi:hypothetical protein C2G38_1977463 [Gigaspora rosea]|uniref:Uncharacterized protein n=1 Tax=Gigaspora rosea TaxID=44941 RepID=A0A397UP30_9GLOM|nr:hypothetical protein C2G38_1977463 [Gigaspora rosea]
MDAPYSPRKCSMTNCLITTKDYASVQNVKEVNKFKMLKRLTRNQPCFMGFICCLGESNDSLNWLATRVSFLKNVWKYQY